MYKENYKVLENQVITNNGTEDPRFLFSSEMSEILYYLSSNDFMDIIQNEKIFFKNNLIEVFEQGYFPQKIALSFFLIKTNNVNLFKGSKLKKLIRNEKNFLVLKSLILCFAFHKKSKVLFPIKFKKLCKESSSFNKITYSNLIKEWYKIKSNRSNLLKPFELDSVLDFSDASSAYDYYIDEESDDIKSPNK